nr:MAK10-like protein [Tanacetum cinerariifolium]
PTQDDAAPKQDRSKWFKHDVERPETPDHEWFKEPNADDAPGHNWFNEMVNAEKDLFTFDDLMGSTVDFTKFAKHYLKKDKITKAYLEGPTFNLLKGNYRTYIKLKYNMEQCYLALTATMEIQNDGPHLSRRYKEVRVSEHIASSYKICGGLHDTQYCMENPKQAFFDYASLHTGKAGVSSARSYSMEDPKSSSNPFKSVNVIRTCFKSTNSLLRDQQQIKTLIVNKIETPKSKELKKALEDDFMDMHLNLSVLEVLAYASMYNAIESLDLGKNGSVFIQSEMLKNIKRIIDHLAGGKLRERCVKKSWENIEDLSLYDNKSWNDPRDLERLVKAISLPQDVSSTSDRSLVKLKNQVQHLMEAHIDLKPSVQVNKIASSCEICGGLYDTQYCMENFKQAFVDYASLCIDEAGDSRLSKFEAIFKQQQSEMTNKIYTFLKVINDRMTGALPSDTVKNPKLNVNPTSSVLYARSYSMEDPKALPILSNRSMLSKRVSNQQILY